MVQNWEWELRECRKLIITIWGKGTYSNARRSHKLKPQLSYQQAYTFISIFLFSFERMVLCRINHSHVMKSARYFQLSSHFKTQICFIFNHKKSRKLILMFWCFWMLTICNFLKIFNISMKKHRKARIISRVVRWELFAAGFFCYFLCLFMFSHCMLMFTKQLKRKMRHNSCYCL